MKIRNITESEVSSRVCYFDLIIEGKMFLKSIRLVRTDEHKFMLAMIPSRRSGPFSCSLSKDIESQIIAAVVDKIPTEWVEKADIIKFKPTNIENENKTLLVEIDL